MGVVGWVWVREQQREGMALAPALPPTRCRLALVALRLIHCPCSLDHFLFDLDQPVKEFLLNDLVLLQLNGPPLGLCAGHQGLVVRLQLHVRQVRVCWVFRLRRWVITVVLPPLLKELPLALDELVVLALLLPFPLLHELQLALLFPLPFELLHLCLLPGELGLLRLTLQLLLLLFLTLQALLLLLPLPLLGFLLPLQSPFLCSLLPCRLLLCLEPEPLLLRLLFKLLLCFLWDQVRLLHVSDIDGGDGLVACA
mmetsp:Transcript_8768/g.15672  ORF Transcript_8768/g.15672 Transcript_8768/m.15672 type:complete len:254 (-) Transcript_8768:649-1410(-)